MLPIQTRTLELAGTSYEIGYRLGEFTAKFSPQQAMPMEGMEGFGPELTAQAEALFERWCPGLTEELHGFADALGAKPEQLCFSAMTYLIPRCSHVALLPSVTKEGKPLLARNYEFSHTAEDFCLIRTSVKGKYTHMGTSVLNLGRDDGFNEHGLAVTISSCGFPVGALPYMRAPKLVGLQFWAVTRALLENCKDVDEALTYLNSMPIAYNINMILLDKGGHAALFETVDGHTAIKRIGPGDEEQLLCATNHAVLPELASIEPRAMAHSLRRYQFIQEHLSEKTGLEQEQLKDLLLAMYPNGLCCHYFEEYFGTTKSMVISPVDGTIELCWGGRAENGWNTYPICQPLPDTTREAHLLLEKAAPETYSWLPTL